MDHLVCVGQLIDAREQTALASGVWCPRGITNDRNVTEQSIERPMCSPSTSRAAIAPAAHDEGGSPEIEPPTRAPDERHQHRGVNGQIQHAAALVTDQVAVGIRIGLPPRGAQRYRNRFHQLEVGEFPENGVDRLQREPRHGVPQGGVQFFGRGVPFRTLERAEHGHPLGRNAAAPGPKPSDRFGCRKASHLRIATPLPVPDIHKHALSLVPQCSRPGVGVGA